VRLLREDAVTRPHAAGALVIDDTGDRKDGPAMAHVARQYLGSVGKTDQGIVVVTSLWADEHAYWPVDLAPYTPASRLPGGERDPGFATKPQLAVELIAKARAAAIAWRSRFARSWPTAPMATTPTSWTRWPPAGPSGTPWVLALRPSRGIWAREADPHTPVEAAQALAWGGPAHPGDWTPVTRTFRDGHSERWWAADAQLGGWGPTASVRLVVATTDPATLPRLSTWYLLTNLARRPRRGRPAPADLAELVRLYGLRMWVEQGYKQVKNELGWADFQVRSARAIRRHLVLVCCAFSFCWHATHATPDAQPVDPPPGHPPPAVPAHPAAPTAARGATGTTPSAVGTRRIVAAGAASSPRLADPMARAAALVAGVVALPATPGRAGPADVGRSGQTAVPLHAALN
jgi:DDE superfamily endonuclease